MWSACAFDFRPIFSQDRRMGKGGIHELIEGSNPPIENRKSLLKAHAYPMEQFNQELFVAYLPNAATTLIVFVTLVSLSALCDKVMD